MSYKLEALKPYERVHSGLNQSKVKNKQKTKFQFDAALQDLLLVFIGFFLARSIIMYDLSPFGFAFFSYIMATRRKKTWTVIGLLVGLFTVQSTLYIIRAVITLALTYWVMGKRVKASTKTWKIGLLSSLCVFSVGLVFQWIAGNYLYDFLLLVFESFITYILLFIYSSALPLITGQVKRKIVSNEELICSAILISLTLLGMSELSIYGYSIKNVLGITAIMLFARHLGSGAGAIIGIVVGVVTSLDHIVSPVIIGVYAFSGLMAGVFKDLGKIPVALGFVLGNAALTFYLNGSTEVFIHIQEILIAIILLLLAPRGIEERISSFKGIGDYRLEREKMYGERVREVTIERLRDYSKVFEQIGKSFEQSVASDPLLYQKDINDVFNRVSKEVCNQCSYYSKCWKLDFYNTYQSMFLLLNKIEKCSTIKQEDIPKSLSNKCLQPERITKVMSYLYEIYKSNQYWEKQVMESKNLVSQQLQGISEVIQDLSNDMRTDIVFRKEEEEEILIAFDKKEIPIQDVMVLQDGQGKYKVTLYGKPCQGKGYCDKTMGEIISKVLGKEMIMEQHLCKGNGLKNKCKVSFKEATNFVVTTGIVHSSKDAQEVSGDSYSNIPLHDGKYMLALSDGMGSGKRASRESRTTINLLEHFLEAGFNREIALKTINSILMLRSNDEMFSTIDLSIIDQYTAQTEFIKIGAVSTFIKRGEKVEMIASNSLPVGILDEVNIEVSRRQLEDGDFIIMASDGLLDANPFVEDKEKWVREQLIKIKSRNPQRIAHCLFEQARKESKNILKDDITILVAKIWKNK
ncbi:stage II sporulation protein E [Irregularibacter muris]|uniref:Stage II sporulation protein E n=1 Tax=Irregularibacter muris TaxID=1796619 RepID=A0AAE3L3Y2_9FIRM|nr:stage II sporulation protein E [Irregularibacter muris]MCR1899043.1 stage II sporulation protein E [Irregularibacter muris]